MKHLASTILALSLCIAVQGAVAAARISAPEIGVQRDQQLIVLAYHDVREDIKRNFAPDQYAISAENLAMHFAWLRDNNYTIVNVDQVIAAIEGRRPLPDKAVLLTFDDGLDSVYSAVYPLLKLFDYPALVSIVTAWIETEVAVRYENRILSSRDFVTWTELREMQESGLVEIASHTHDLHKGIVGNPQGNVQPAAVTRRYEDGYESRIEYLQRIDKDLAKSSALIKAGTGRAPRVMVWPYGMFNGDLRRIAAAQGMSLSFSLDPDDVDPGDYPVVGRDLMLANPGIADFAPIFLETPKHPIVRAAQIDLDYVYDPDEATQERNLDVLLDRIRNLGITHVYLQAFADPDGDGSADALYFPNRHLPMRADLFNRVSWQLQTRSNVKVFAWMPLLGYTGKAVASDWRLLEQRNENGAAPDTKGEPRISPFVAEARTMVSEIYSDLATYADFDGVHFHDDGRMNEFEDANPAALGAYRDVFGSEFSISGAQYDPALMERWAAFKAAKLNEFSRDLTDAVAYYRPVLGTSRNLFASAILDERGTVFLAQDYNSWLDEYDYVTLMAMPMLEGVPDEGEFFDSLVASVAEHPGGLQRTVFQLQTVDWSDGYRPLPSDQLRERMRRLQSQGVLNLAYYPDDFLKNHPNTVELIRGMSLSVNPVRP